MTLDPRTDTDRILDHNARQRRYFETTPKPRMVPTATPYVERQVERMIRFAGLEKGERILDVGCGMGRYTLPLARRGLTVEGLDLSPGLLEQLRGFDDTGREIPLHAGDVAALAEGLSGRFDAVVGFFFLHHLHDLPISFQAMGRMLRPGGRFAFLEPNAYCPLYYLQVALTPHMRWEQEKGILRMRRGPIAEAVAAAGMVDLRVERFGFAPPVVANRGWGRALERKLEGLETLEGVQAFSLFRATRPAP